ncbi:MAG: hypothetical protein TRG1_2093 [Flavobacteriaceae bacterium FS1-H7996/R]|nr:MAG: hypothetical protein TRG1_2093 [Flavobacteriaceae bacterium FS1-H7996/R]
MDMSDSELAKQSLYFYRCLSHKKMFSLVFDDFQLLKANFLLMAIS